MRKKAKIAKNKRIPPENLGGFCYMVLTIEKIVIKYIIIIKKKAKKCLSKTT